MASQVAGEWYQRKKIDDDITRLWEPYAIVSRRVV